MDEQDPPCALDVPQLAVRVSSAVSEGRAQEKSGVFGEEFGSTQVQVPPPFGSLSLVEGSFGRLHLETSREWGPVGFVEDFRAERGGNVPSHRDVGGTSSPVTPDINRSRGFQEQAIAVNSSSFDGAEDDLRTAAACPGIVLHYDVNCEERFLGISSDFEQGILRDRNDVAAACLDLNVEERPEEGTDSDNLHDASVGEVDVRHVTEDALSSMQVCLDREDGNRRESQTEAVEQLELPTKEREQISQIDLMGRQITTEHSMQGTETMGSTSVFVEQDLKMGSFEVVDLENVHVVDVSDDIGASSSHVYRSSLSVVGNDLQNRTDALHTPFEVSAVQSEQFTHSRSGHEASCYNVFVDAAEEVMGAESQNVQGDSTLQLPDASRMAALERMSKEDTEKHGNPGACMSEGVGSLLSKVESSQENQSIRIQASEAVDNAKQVSEEDISSSGSGEKFLDWSFQLDRQPGCKTFAPKICCEPADDAEGGLYSGTLHEDMHRRAEQTASQLSEQLINQEIVREHKFPLHISENIEEPVSKPSEEVIEHKIISGQEFSDEHDGVHAVLHEPATELIDQEIDAAVSLEGGTDKEILSEQTDAPGQSGKFSIETDQSSMELKNTQICGDISMMQLAGDHIDESAMNVENVIEEQGVNVRMDEDVHAPELTDKELDNEDSTHYSENCINKETSREQNAAEVYRERFDTEDDDSAVVPMEKQIDGHSSIQALEEYVVEEIMRDKNISETYEWSPHVDEDAFDSEILEKQSDGHESSQPSAEEHIDNEKHEWASHVDEDAFDSEVLEKQSDGHESSHLSTEEHIDDEMTKENNTAEGHSRDLQKEKLAMELASRQIDDETSVLLSEDPATRVQYKVDEHVGHYYLEDEKSVSMLVSDERILDQPFMEEKAVDVFGGSLVKAEQNASGFWRDEGSEENEEEEGLEAGSGNCLSEEIEIEEHSAGRPPRVSRERFKFGVGDLVWAKVKSHPWWPGQIFDPADASASAKKVQKPDRILVAFFGDCTFGWLQESQMIAFRPNFEEKVKQTDMKSFCKAIAEALDEVCRRAELGISCSCHGGVLHSASTFPDANKGIKKGVRINHHSDILSTKAGFKSEKILEFVKGVASSPFGLWNFSLEAAEIRGQVYGSRLGIHSMQKPDSDDLLKNVLTGLRDKAGRVFTTPRQGLKLKRRFSSLETDNGIIAGSYKEAKKINTSKDGMLKKPSIEGRLLSLASKNTTSENRTDNVRGIEENKSDSGEVQGLEEFTDDTILGKGKRASFLKKFESSKRLRRTRLDEQEPESKGGTGAAKEKSSDNGEVPISMQGTRAAKGKRPADGEAPKLALVTQAAKDKGSDDDAETLIALAGFHSKLLKKRGKGNTLEGSIKSSAEVKSVSKTVKNREVSRETQEADPGKRLLKAERLSKESVVSKAEITSNSSLPELAALHSERTSGQVTKYDNNSEPSMQEDAELPTDVITVQSESTKKVVDNNVHMKDQRMADEVPVTVLNSKNLQEGILKGEKQSSSIIRPKQETDVKKPNKAIKVGECIQRIAGELTGTSPPITKSVDRNSSKRAVFDVNMKSGLKRDMKSSIPDSAGLPKNHRPPAYLSVNEKTRQNSVQLLQGLHFLAKNPLDNGNAGKPLSEVIAAFLKFRDMVFQKSAGYGSTFSRAGEQTVGKIDGHLSNSDHFSDPKSLILRSQPATQELSPSILKHGVQELALAARKRKSEVVQEGLAKMSKRGVLTSTPKGQHPFKVTTSAVKFMEQSHRNKHQRHYPSRTSSLTSDVKSPIRQSDDKVSSNSPVGLYMKFPQSFALPSEAQLKATFIRFGALQTAGTRVYRSNASAQVVFKHGTDAEMALKYAKENPIFGQAAVTFRLRHFSQPERNDSRRSMSSLENEKSTRGDGRLSSPPMERLESMHHVVKPSSLDRGECGRTGTVADFANSRQLQSSENPGNNNISLNLSSLIPNSASTVNESSGDIQDQMIKLLRQVSVIVSSSSLTTEAS